MLETTINQSNNQNVVPPLGVRGLGVGLILFDGVCNLCNGLVQFVIRHDKNEVFKFASLQSEFSRRLLAEMNLLSTELNSIVLIENGIAYTHSDAVLKIIKQLDRRISWMYVFRFMPRFIRNFFYEIIAKYRYRVFGKREVCMVPDGKLESKFLN